VRKISFTGSTAVGKHLAAMAGQHMKRVTMELGGHAPAIVFDDADLDVATKILAANKFRNAGQVCIAPTRFHVQEGVYEAFAQGFAERTRALNMGDGLDPKSQMGPMANHRRPQAIAAMVEDARSAGARILTGGGLVDERGGFFYPPTVLADVPMGAKAMNDEPFGPVALIRPFATVEEAIAQANRLPYGLAAYCFTENGRRQNLLGDVVESGMVAINSVRLTWPDSPFGGMKDSGFGSEDGPEGVAAHMITKTVHMM